MSHIEPGLFGHAKAQGALGPRVEDERPRQVDDRVADTRHLPVHDGQQPGGRLQREQYVVELVVTVAQGARLAGGPVRTQPVGHVVGGRELPTTVGVELGEPPGDLARQVVVAVGQVTQAAGVPIDGVDGHEGVDELLERPAV